MACDRPIKGNAKDLYNKLLSGKYPSTWIFIKEKAKKDNVSIARYVDDNVINVFELMENEFYQNLNCFKKIIYKLIWGRK